MNHYSLSADGKTPILETNRARSLSGFNSANRIVAKTKIGDAEVSTIFLVFDHGWDGEPPVLWETMVFGGSMDQEQDRCGGNRDDAQAMHQRMVQKVLSREPESTTNR